ncbi:MAG TPA: hypothetical protein DIW36_00355 [Ruminococcaceae bacterium]|nr:hypothetical protein [Oscillospiraceae bacterium]HCT15867.1 hypothetical protein [Oscillospiraceae bacterium]
MKNTIIASIVAILCTAAICTTYAVKSPAKKADSAVSSDTTYMTEAEAADYIGVTDEVMKMMRENLKSFEGAYVSYYYTNADGKEVNDIVYNKAALDKAVQKIMSEQGSLNFKYIQEVTTNEAK